MSVPVVTLAALLFFPSVGDARPVPQVCHTKHCVNVEVVSKSEDTSRGLMYRDRLGKDKGMLFVFNQDSRYRFWMKNMKFSLDILWIDQQGTIVSIALDVPACAVDPCPGYTPEKEARYVLELNSGYTKAHHWKVGDKLELKGI